jgi:hypothetical protein
VLQNPFERNLGSRFGVRLPDSDAVRVGGQRPPLQGRVSLDEYSSTFGIVGNHSLGCVANGIGHLWTAHPIR